MKVIRNVKGMGRRRKLILAVFVLVLVFTGFQIFRTVQYATYWRQHRDEPIAGWMRLGYVANSFDVPLPVLNQAIGLEPDARDRRPLTEVAKSQGRSLDEIKADLEKAITDYRVAQPPPNTGGGP